MGLTFFALIINSVAVIVAVALLISAVIKDHPAWTMFVYLFLILINAAFVAGHLTTLLT